MKRGPTAATLQKQVEAFNNAVNVGDLIEYEGIRGDPSTRAQFRTRTQAQILSGHTAVVWLEGKSGCVCVTHCSKVAA